MNTKVLLHSTLGTLFAVTALSGLMRCAQDNDERGSKRDGLDPNRRVLYEEYNPEANAEDEDLELTGASPSPTAAPIPTPIPDAATQENASMLIRIVKPYCRNADLYGITAAIKIESYCVGTVISNGTRPFVITAAHCFATECPAGSKVPGTSTAISGASDSIPMANIQIPNSASIAKIMTGFDWSNSSKVLTAKNVKILPGFTGDLQRGAKNATIPDPWSGATASFAGFPLFISRDIAIIDFGPQLALNTATGTGFPSMSYETTPVALGSSTMEYASTDRNCIGGYTGCPRIFTGYKSTHFSCWFKSSDPSSCSPTPVSSGNSPNLFDPTKLERVYEDNVNDPTYGTGVNLSSGFNSLFTNSFVTTGNATLGNSNSFGNYNASRITFGDSGSSMLYNATVIGIASAVQLDDPNYFATGFPYGFNARQIHPLTSYSAIDKSLVDQAITSLLSSTATANITLGVDLWAVKPTANWTPGDNTSVPSGPAHAKRFISTYVNPHVTTSNTTSVPWAKIPVTTGSTTYVKSYTANGVLDAIPAIGSGTRTATWVANGLTQGYYDVSMLYPMNSGNAKCIQVLRRTNADTAYIKGDSTHLPIFGLLNQQIGDAAKTVSTAFNNTFTSLTPAATSAPVMSKTYVWVSNNAKNAANSGVLGIKITDSGCGTAAAPAGRMIGDTIQLTIKGTTK